MINNLWNWIFPLR